MSTQHTPNDADRVLELARGGAAPALPETDLRRLVRRSVVAAAERRAHARQRWAFGAVVALSAVVLLVALSPARELMRERWTQATAAPRKDSPKLEGTWTPLEVALPTGDRLAASPGAQFELVHGSRVTRRIALREGTVVFAVEPLASGESFGVQTPHAYVEVRGTVFSVQVDVARTRVRVHEGAVQVLGSTAPKMLRVGERYGSDGEPVPELDLLPLAKRAAELSAERMRKQRDEAEASKSAERRTVADASAGPGTEPPLDEPARLAAAEASTLEHARALLHQGDSVGALMAAEAALPRTPERGEWLLLQGDALRSLSQPRQAIASYLEAEASLDAGSAPRAAFKAADLYLRVLGDPSAALAVLNRTRLDAPGSPLRERALALRIDAAERLGLPVRALAERYLEAYPDSAGAVRMRRLVEAP